ncbi:ABATE domain-containing protein, partial [Nonomuraea pusilla]|uniref:ABATE domain-containing protein n=1 Tax=Nonomuraea pusilla TaxID=46177 RepID=UPI00343695CC
MSDVVPLTGEPLALDLVNTRPSVGDLLATADRLRAWLALEADRFPEARELAELGGEPSPAPCRRARPSRPASRSAT